MKEALARLWQRLRSMASGEAAPSTGEEISSQTAPLPETRPLDTAEVFQKAQADGLPLRPAQWQVGVGLSTGLQRDHNEDAVLAQTLTLAAGEYDVPFGLYAVADGMGGHQFGEVASATAIRALARYIEVHLLAPLMAEPTAAPDVPLLELMGHAVAEANQAVLRAAPGGGTTLTAALLVGKHITIAHVGDSRACYVHPEGRLQVLTRDHSLVKRLEELGQLTEEEAAVHPQRNVLYRALGQGEPLEPDVFQIPLPKAGHLVLCSDGLWGVVPAEEFLAIVQEAATPLEACARLVHQANERGGPDNISVIVLRFGEAVGWR